MHRKICLLLLSLLLSLAIRAADEKPIRVSILHVNDTHGVGLLPDKSGKSRVACAATVINRLRAASTADKVFVVHVGDLLRVHALGKPPTKDALAEKSRGMVDMAVLNELRFDFLAPGNHELDHGLEYAREVLGKVRFPVVNANMLEKSTGQRVFKPYVIATAGGARVAFIGLSPGCMDRGYYKTEGVVDRDTLETARELVPEVRKQADVIVLLAHLNHGKWTGDDVTDERLAATVPGIDVICGGHTHTRIDHGETVRNPEGRDTLIVQAQWHWLFIGQVDLTLEPTVTGYRVAAAAAHLNPVDLEKETPDPGVLRVIDAMR